MAQNSQELPPDITVLERGWLSSNNILIQGTQNCALIDSGYATHSSQTLALLRAALGTRPLDLLLNTHLHSDHCGGNAALQQAYPGLQTHIPPGLAMQVAQWDPVALTYVPTGQQCPRFSFDACLQPGQVLRLGDRDWQVHAAPGHDPHSVVLFEPHARVLVSADALWETGFGVVFPELEGEAAFEEVAQTLDVIEDLAPLHVIPGHGRPFQNVASALDLARQRLASFVQMPERHAKHAAKVLLKFKLLETQRMPLADFSAWAMHTGYFALIHGRYFSSAGERHGWLDQLLNELKRSGALELEDGWVINL